tara:strand:+ start:62223 stop:62453 length:231 start_codon:yes stop_codon:yes gene_type:complete
MNNIISGIAVNRQVKDMSRCKTCINYQQGKCTSEFSGCCNGYTHHEEKWWVIFKDMLLTVIVVSIIMSPFWVFSNW